jgi:PucR C-terminal helix-turn-helix domain
VSESLRRLLERLQVRRAELEEAVRTRVYSIADPAEIEDPVYLHGFQMALEAAIDFAFSVAEGADRPPPVPPALLVQARLAAFSGVSLDTVLRRYFVGYTVLHDFFVEEADDALDGPILKQLLRNHGLMFERLVGAVGDEYRRADPQSPLTPNMRRVDQVRRLLDGEVLESAALEYDFDAHHVGMIVLGDEHTDALKTLGRTLDCHVMCVKAESGVTWSWLGSRRPLEVSDAEEHVRAVWREQVPVAFGETARGIAGWRLTHRQAKAAFKVSLRHQDSIARYREVALLAAAIGDEVLTTSLRDQYLDPVSAGGADAGVAVATLRAYFAAEGKISSAAAALGVNRNTVTERLRAIEARLGRSIASCAAEIEVALQLEALDSPESLPVPGTVP